MITIPSINSYELDRDISFFAHSVVPFKQEGYEWAKTWGRQLQFKDEEFFWATERNFLKRECKQAMIATIAGIIYKISYRFHDVETSECVALRERAYDFITHALGKYTNTQEIESDHHVISWQASNGNVILEFDCFDTEVVLTSNSVRSAKQASFIGRLFNK